MASKVTGASLDGIYGRLNDMPQYNPMTADTFADWSTEAGDVVTMVRGTEVYETPLHSTSMVWRGAPQMSISTTGNKEREPLAKVSRQRYGGGSGAKRNDEEELRYIHSIIETDSYWRATYDDLLLGLHAEIELTASHFRTALDDTANSLHSEIVQTSSYWRASLDDATNSLHSEIVQTSSYWRASLDDATNSLHSEILLTASVFRTALDDTASSLHSEIVQTSSYWRASLDDATNSLHSEIVQTSSYWRSSLDDATNSLHSEIVQTANSWSVKISGVADANGNVTAASIAVAINNAGESEAHISADKVYIGTEKSSTVIAGKCELSDVTANYIAGKIAEIPTLSGIVANFSGNITSGSALSGYQVYADGRNISNPIMYVTVTGPSNNVYTLTATKADGTYNSFNFSRATTLSGTWSGGTFTVSASPQGDSTTTEIMDVSNADVTWNGNIASFPVKANRDGGETVYNTGKTLSINASGRDAASGSASGRSGSSYDWTFTITRGDGTTKNLEIDCSLIYSDARSGYTQGIFTLADITLQGSPDTVYKEVSVGGTNYYQADTPVTYYVGGSTGTYYTAGSGTKYDRGTGLTAYPVVSSGGTIYYQAGSQTTYRQAGSGTKYDRGTGLTAYPVVSSGGTIYYQAGSQTTYRQAGSGTKYDRGTGLTAYPVVSSGGTIYYEAGTQATYYNAGTSSYTARGDSVTAREVVSSGGTVYYTAGTATTYYKGNGGSFTVQGSSVSVTPIGSVRYFQRHVRSSDPPTGTYWYSMHTSKPSSGTIVTVYYAGSSTTYYNAGTTTKYARGDSVSVTPISSTSIQVGSATTYYKGNGGSFTAQGTSATFTPIKATSAIRLGSSGTYYPGNGGSFTPQGAEVTVTPISATTAIRLGSSGTYYPGNGGAFTPQGAEVAVTPISATTAIRLGSSGTYYPGNGGAFIPQGTEVSITARGDPVTVTPVKASTEKMLASTTRYTAGTRYQDTYYTKS